MSHGMHSCKTFFRFWVSCLNFQTKEKIKYSSNGFFTILSVKFFFHQWRVYWSLQPWAMAFSHFCCFHFFYRGHKHIKSLIWYLFSFFGSALKSWSSDNKIMKGRKIISTYTCKDTSRFLKKLYFIECEVEKWFVV